MQLKSFILHWGMFRFNWEEEVIRMCFLKLLKLNIIDFQRESLFFFMPFLVCRIALCIAYQQPKLMMYRLLVRFTILELFLILNINKGIKSFPLTLIGHSKEQNDGFYTIS